MYFPTLGSIASHDVVSLGMDETVETAVAKMHAHNHRSIVVANHSLYYLFTTQDLIRLKLEGVSFTTLLRELPLPRLPLLGKDQNVMDALNLLDKSAGYICLSGDEGELYGLVTFNDIISSVDPQVMLENLTLGSMFESRFGYITLESDCGMSDVMREMVRADTDSVIVTEKKRPVGIVTSKDILRYFKHAGGEDFALSHCMSAPLRMLPSECTIGHALRFLRKHAFKRIVVSADDGSVVGIVSEQELLTRTYSNWSSHIKEHFSEVEELTQVLNEKNRMLTKMATRDALTGIANRYLFEELFEKEFARVQRYGRTLSLLIMDIDRFKTVNDTFGHNVGDYVLKELAGLVGGLIRKADTFARWGGEEFVLMLPDTVAEQAVLAAEKLREGVQAHTFEHVGTITCSFGVAEVLSGSTLEGAVENADKALYEAKEQGRNRVVRFTPGS